MLRAGAPGGLEKAVQVPVWGSRENGEARWLHVQWPLPLSVFLVDAEGLLTGSSALS